MTDRTDIDDDILTAEFGRRRMVSELRKLDREARFVLVQTIVLPFTAAAAVIGATAAIVKVFFT